MSDAAPNGFLASEETLERFFAAFYDGTLPRPEWTHGAHVALAAYLLYDSDVAAVLPKIRYALWNYIEATGGKNVIDTGYHETLTVFWRKVVARELKEQWFTTRMEAVRGIVATYGEARGLARQYYSYDLKNSNEARRQWVEPDLRSI